MSQDIERRTLGWARGLAGGAATIAVLALIGHLTGSSTLVRLAAPFQGMSFLTACAIGVLAIGVVAATRRRERIVTGAVGATIVIVGLVLASHLAGDADRVNPAIQHALFGTPLAGSPRMSTGTALTLLLVAASLASRKRPRLSDWAAGAGLLITGTALLGYVYSIEDLYALSIFTTMALHTALALMLLCLATLLVEPAHGWSATLLSPNIGGRVTRRQLGLLILPAVIGWVLREGTVSHQLGTGSALALLVVLTVAPMALLVLRDGRAQIELDAERRAHEAAREALAIDLERRLALRTGELAREGAERSKIEEALYRTQRVEAIGQLTGGIAHDFNNLLAAIGGNLELMMRKLPEGHLARRYAVTAATAVAKGAKLAGQLLAFSRSQRLAIQPVALEPALQRARDLIVKSLGPSFELLLEYPREPVWVLTDPEQLDLALFNLAQNARDAMPEGGPLRIESDVRELRLPAGSDARSFVSIRMIDQGVGMAPDVVAKAIEPFFTTRARGKGTGLGLAQAYGFVRQCEGDLVIDSAPGEGTIVEILLPLTTAPHGVAAAREPIERRRDATDDARPRLLVIDDDDAVRGVLVELLGDAGYDVTPAADGASALACLDRIRPDAAVVDFMMPGMNGAEVARAARAWRQDLPIVFVSGYSETVALDGIANAIVLRKPFRGDELRMAVETALASKVA